VRKVPAAQYEVVVCSQAGAEPLLHDLGALAEIEEAILAHCAATEPTPPYRPEEYKRLLEQQGWRREVRVPPFHPKHDGLRINERYDAMKLFTDADREVGVAIEMEGWEINNDLLKFRRGIERGQIVAGVILQPDYATLHYSYEHSRHVHEPLFGDIPIAFVCPRGPGLEEPTEQTKRTFAPYLMPKQ
jgi:hypothetical protein